MGIEVVVVASAADKDQAWLADVDHVVTIGGPHAAVSYLDQDALLEVARHCGVSAIHPGWGFLAENDVFAARCASAGITFVGPSPEHMRQMGDKALARRTMRALGLDPIPGSRAIVDDVDHARVVAREVGYPILLKAVAGGGGKGMRGVDRPEDLAQAFAAARGEAVSSFGDGRLYIERRILGGRHIEVQVIADHEGNCIHLGDRECSLQRRHQKVLEEALSPGLPEEERARILPLVADVVRRSGYVNAGTIEMLLDRDGHAWFMEMNTRLQVEHPVTECITGLDLVELQLRVAAREPLPLRQEDVVFRGHAIECRINAEDPSQGFRPSPGRVTRLDFPTGKGIRVDTHLRAGDRIPPYYDSMIAKLIVHGDDRADALDLLGRALQEVRIEGVKTNLDLQRRIVAWDVFRQGRYDTTSLESDLMGD
jgi:acetyl-CoA carboxylase biotin carboxylase subunit